MYQLAAMELDSIDQEDGIVDAWDDRRVGFWQTASAVLRFVRRVSKAQTSKVS